MKDVYYAVISGTIGDTICATPTLRKLYQVYQRKINVVSQLILRECGLTTHI